MTRWIFIPLRHIANYLAALNYAIDERKDTEINFTGDHGGHQNRKR